MTDYEREQVRKTRAYLWRWGATMSVVKRKEAEIASMHFLVADATQTLHAQQITDMPRGTQVGDPTMRAVLELERRREAYEQTNAAATEVICARLAEKRMVDELMQTWLTDFQIQILTMRYVNNHDWDYIALKIPCAESTARAQEHRAVRKLMYRIDIQQKSGVF